MAPVPDATARTVLPIPDRAYAGPILYDAKNPDVGSVSIFRCASN